MTTVAGTYTLCGSTWVLDFNCSGPECGVFTDYPDVSCATANGDLVTCTSATSCDGPVNYSSSFTYTQPGSTTVTSTDNITLPVICEQIEAVSDFTRAGTSVQGSDIPACVPSFSQPASCSPSSSSVAPSSVAPSSVAPSSITPSSIWSSSIPPSSTEYCYEPSVELPTQSSAAETSPASNTSTDAPRTETSTILSTWTYTITSCKPTVTNCPLGKVTTEVVTSYTTYCPDDYTQPKPGAPQTDGAGGHGHPQAATSVEAWGHGTAPTKVEAWEHGTAPTAGHATVLPSGSPGRSPVTTQNATAPLALASPAPVYTAGAGRARPPTVSFLWCGLLLVFGFFAQGIAALAPPALSSRRSEVMALHDRQVIGNAVAMADKLVAHFNTRLPDSDLADTLVRRLLDIGCDMAIEDKCGTTISDLAQSKAFAVDFTSACRAAITDLAITISPEIVQTPGGAILLSLDTGLLCSFMLGSFFHVPELVDGVCAYPKPCTDDFTSDPNNCGRCGNVCPSGICQRSSCVSNSCTGQTCDTFTACGPGGSCVCASTFEGTGVCGDGQTPCAGLADCNTSADCAAGYVCAINTCCTRNICIAATDSCAGSGPDVTPARLLMRTYENATVGDRGVWVP